MIPNEEVMLIWGGITYRNRTFTDGKITYNIFDDCEAYSRVTGITEDNMADVWKKCGEELVDDMWFYYVKRNSWVHIIPDINKESKKVIVPSARYGHSGMNYFSNIILKVAMSSLKIREP